MDNNEIIANIKLSPAGTKTVYYVGFLSKDKGLSVFSGKTPEQKELTILQDLVYECYLNGFCTLTQKKISDSRYKYIATTLPKEGAFARALKNRQLHDSAHSRMP